MNVGDQYRNKVFHIGINIIAVNGDQYTVDWIDMIDGKTINTVVYTLEQLQHWIDQYKMVKQ